MAMKSIKESLILALIYFGYFILVYGELKFSEGMPGVSPGNREKPKENRVVPHDVKLFDDKNASK